MRAFIGGIALFGLTAFGQVGIFSTRSTSLENGTLTVTLGAPRMMMGPALAVVVGAPYSADQVFEHTRTLVDGTHITQNRTMQHSTRDSLGRTRIEQPLVPEMRRIGPGSNESSSASEPMLVEIQDPVGGYVYALDTQNKVAHRFAIPPVSERRRQPVQRAAGSGGGGSGSVSAGPAASGASARPEMSAPEDLGTQTMEGVPVEGMRRTIIWPIGSQGNDRPITVTTETWRSRDLQMTVLSKNLSPLNGDSITRLTNISRAEPDPSLFQAPAGYSVVDEKDSFTITVKQQQ